jgi:hypothetical protein
MASHMTNTHPLHHPVGGNLPSYLSISASLHNSKLRKVIAKSKTLLVCHLLRLQYFLYGHLSISSPQVFEIVAVHDLLHP